MSTINFANLNIKNFALYDHQVDLVDKMTSAQSVSTLLVGPLMRLNRKTVLDFSGLSKDQTEWIATVLAYIKPIVDIKEAKIIFPKSVHLRNVNKGRAFRGKNTRAYKDQTMSMIRFVNREADMIRIVEVTTLTNFNKVKFLSIYDHISDYFAKANLVESDGELLKRIECLSKFSQSPFHVRMEVADVPNEVSEESHDLLIPIQCKQFDAFTNDPELSTEILWNIRG